VTLYQQEYTVNTGQERLVVLNDLFNSIHYGKPITYNECRKLLLLLNMKYSTFRLKAHAESIGVDNENKINHKDFIALYYSLLNVDIADRPAHIAAIKIQSILRRKAAGKQYTKKKKKVKQINDAAVLIQNKTRTIQAQQRVSKKQMEQHLLQKQNAEEERRRQLLRQTQQEQEEKKKVQAQQEQEEEQEPQEQQKESFSTWGLKSYFDISPAAPASPTALTPPVPGYPSGNVGIGVGADVGADVGANVHNRDHMAIGGGRNIVHPSTNASNAPLVSSLFHGHSSNGRRIVYNPMDGVVPWQRHYSPRQQPQHPQQPQHLPQRNSGNRRIYHSNFLCKNEVEFKEDVPMAQVVNPSEFVGFNMQPPHHPPDTSQDTSQDTSHDEGIARQIAELREMADEFIGVMGQINVGAAAQHQQRTQRQRRRTKQEEAKVAAQTRQRKTVKKRGKEQSNQVKKGGKSSMLPREEEKGGRRRKTQEKRKCGAVLSNATELTCS
jgi:hypothetical protein